MKKNQKKNLRNLTKTKTKTKKMKLNEVFTGENAVFEKIFEPNFPVLYQQIFGEDNPQILDINLKFNFGERTLVDSITNDNAQEILKSVITVKFDSWAKQVQVFNYEYDVLNPTTGTETTTESVNVDETGNNNTVDSKTTFNDGNFANDTKQQRDTTGNRKETTEKTVSKSGVPVGTPVSEIIQKEMNLRKNNLKEMVIKDLVYSITLDIY